MVALFVEIFLEILSSVDCIDFCLYSEIVYQNCQVDVVVAHDGDHCMCIFIFGVLKLLGDNTWLSWSISLDNSDNLSNFEAISDLETSDLHLKRFSLIGHEWDISIIVLIDEALTSFELAFNNLDSFSNLDLQLWVISDCL